MVRRVISLAAIAAVHYLFSGASSGQVLFSDNFDDGNAATRWSVLQGSSSGTLSNLAFDYSTIGAPSAPRGTGNIGVALDVNRSGNLLDALNLFPNGQNFSGDFTFRTDIYFHAPDGTDVSSLTEEFLLGINASGSKVNYAGSATPAFSDGTWYTMTGDGGRGAASATGDTDRFDGNSAAAATRTKLGDNRDDISSINMPDPDLLAGYGAVGDNIRRWVTLEISQTNKVLRMAINGVMYNEFDNSAGAFNSGNIFLGYQDPFTGSINADVHGVYDNVEVRRIARYTGASGDSFTDGTKWATGAVPNGVDAYAALDAAATSPTTLTLNSGVTLGSLTMRNANSYTISGTGTITIDSTSPRAAITASLGTHTISTAMVYNKTVAFTTGAGTSTVNEPLAKLTLTGNQTFAAGVGLFKGGQGELSIPRVRLSGGGALSIAAGTLTIAHASANNAPASVSTVQRMYLENRFSAAIAGTMDLTNNTLIYDYEDGFHFFQNYTGAEGYAIKMLTSGYAAGAWTGKGLRSSDAAAAAATGTKTAIGWAEKTDLGTTTFNGETLPDDTTVVFTYTLVGDANLDYKVNTLDFNLLAASFGDNSQFRSWHDGNFDFDALSVVDSIDFTAMVANYGKTLPVSAPSLGSVVPEPASLAMIGLTPLFFRRRRG